MFNYPLNLSNKLQMPDVVIICSTENPQKNHTNFLYYFFFKELYQLKPSGY